MDKNKKLDSKKPEYILQMEAIYGPPSQSGFGSAVFSEIVEKSEPLERSAKQIYKYFVGEIWDRFGEDAWLSGWKQVYNRQMGTEHDIVAELNRIKDPDASLSVLMILDALEEPDFGKFALSEVFDANNVNELKVYNLGDGGAMSGLLIASRRSNNQATFLVFLMD